MAKGKDCTFQNNDSCTTTSTCQHTRLILLERAYMPTIIALQIQRVKTTKQPIKSCMETAYFLTRCDRSKEILSDNDAESRHSGDPH